MTSTSDIPAAGRLLAHHELVTAFGHVSRRTPEGMLITPGKPLGSLSETDLVAVPADAETTGLPEGAPKEAWLHLAIYAVRPDVAAICRAQPEWVAAADATRDPILPLHGQGSFCGAAVPVHTDSRLARDPELGRRIAESLGDGTALVLRGNGALTVGPTVAAATALMWVLEYSARLNVRARSAGTPVPLPTDEQDAWRTTQTELLTRLWQHLSH
ncbi:class II aldolase/adducin family protein [Granulicoccus phenolivorans]|uniref:class II aldolase/adducin family protein n=1 Tax=Granulicoccus phenolivorans TaxID=266854 RepID=UPI0003F5EA01|nr:class II aldolase/adducin family protein [Granulicoccus phenolivorans]